MDLFLPTSISIKIKIVIESIDKYEKAYPTPMTLEQHLNEPYENEKVWSKFIQCVLGKFKIIDPDKDIKIDSDGWALILIQKPRNVTCEMIYDLVANFRRKQLIPFTYLTVVRNFNGVVKSRHEYEEGPPMLKIVDPFSGVWTI